MGLEKKAIFTIDAQSWAQMHGVDLSNYSPCCVSVSNAERGSHIFYPIKTLYNNLSDTVRENADAIVNLTYSIGAFSGGVGCDSGITYSITGTALMKKNN